MNFGSGTVAEGASGEATGRGPSVGRWRYNGPPPPKLDVGGGRNSQFAFGAANWPYNI